MGINSLFPMSIIFPIYRPPLLVGQKVLYPFGCAPSPAPQLTLLPTPFPLCCCHSPPRCCSTVCLRTCKTRGKCEETPSNGIDCCFYLRQERLAVFILRIITCQCHILIFDRTADGRVIDSASLENASFSPDLSARV